MPEESRLDQHLEALLEAHGEQDIRSKLAHLLFELNAGQYNLEVRVGTGAADLVCVQYRVVIETKARGDANPTKRRSGSTETQHEQLLRYVKTLAQEQLAHYDATPWRAFLTDGLVWWGWEWHPTDTSPSLEGELIPLDEVQNRNVASDIATFSGFVSDHLAPDARRGTPTPPPLRELFDPYLAELRELIPQVETTSTYATKFKLWWRTLQGSGLVQPGAVGQAHNFAEHTMLVIAARMIVMAAQEDSNFDDLPAAVADGFCAWLNDFEAGKELLTRLSHDVSKYDWRNLERDLLKELYHELIDRKDRKEFGEYYTPDWLAADVVEQVLLKDPARLDAAIQIAAQAANESTTLNDQRSEAYAVLDPACGSGTFLFWTAKAIAKRIRAAHPLLLNQTRSIVAAMVTGLDVHPIAVEMSKATLATALPPGPSVPLRVYLADGLLHSLETQQNLQGTLGIFSAQGHRIDIPAAVINSPNAVSLVDALVDVAVGKTQLDESDSETQEILAEVVDELAGTIAQEGNHVWRWYIGNQVAPVALARNKVMAIVANPPWLVANDTPAGVRKDQLANLSERYGLRPKSRWSAKGDLAALFSARAIDLYLANGGAFGLVLPGSALINQTWAKWRNGRWGDAQISFSHLASYENVDPPPFPHAPNGTCVVIGERNPASPLTKWQDATKLVYAGNPEELTVSEAARRESQQSVYAKRFRRGATASPLGLCLVLDANRVGKQRRTATVTTKESTKGRWKGVTFTAEVETASLVRTLRAQAIRPFVGSPDAWIIAPLSVDLSRVMELHESDFEKRLPLTHKYWQIAEERYVHGRAETAGATLSRNVDYHHTLTKQLTNTADLGTCKVFYNKSGETLRACRGTANLVADDKSYWYVAESEAEALYLCGILNAQCLQDAWRESKTSARHFDTNPLKHVPVPQYNPNSKLHAKIVAAAQQAEHQQGSNLTTLDAAVSELLPQYSTQTAS